MSKDEDSLVSIEYVKDTPCQNELVEVYFGIPKKDATYTYLESANPTLTVKITVPYIYNHLENLTTNQTAVYFSDAWDKIANGIRETWQGITRCIEEHRSFPERKHKFPRPTFPQHQQRVRNGNYRGRKNYGRR